jgi:hypothetical protein
MPESRFSVNSGTLISGFVIGLVIGAVMAVLWPNRQTAELPISAPAASLPLSPETNRTPASIPDPAMTQVDPVTISRERGQVAARHRRQELGLR